MKISSLALATSLAANAALLAFLVIGAVDNSAPTASSNVAPETKTSAPTRATDPAPGADTWAALQSGDLQAQRDRLRAEDFPPALIRAILAAQIREGFAARRKALEAAQADQPYWKNPLPDPATQAAYFELARAEQKALKDLLGPDPDYGLATSLHRQLPNLSDDKIDALAAIRERYDQKRQDLYATISGTFMQDDQEKLAALDQAQHAEFASALTPAELEDYDLRTSRAANQVRNNLAAFDATEQEFRALYKLQSTFDAQFGQLYSAPSEEQMRARTAAQKQLMDDIKAAVGDQRFADYQRATNSSYRQASQLVGRLELPPETANQVYALQQDLQQRAGTIRRSAGSAEAAMAELTALAAEAKAKVTAALGDRGFEAYKQNGGQWLQNLAPRPPPPKN